jgi:hypothetical protein
MAEHVVFASLALMSGLSDRSSGGGELLPSPLGDLIPW